MTSISICFGENRENQDLEYLEKELEAPLWICFSLGYILLIFDEKKFILFFAENFSSKNVFRLFLDENPRFSIFDDGSDIVEKSSKKVGKFFSMKKFSAKKKVGKFFFLKNQ